MKSLIATAAIAAVLSLSALGTQAHETDRAVGAGSFVHPTGPANGVWDTASQSVSKHR